MTPPSLSRRTFLLLSAGASILTAPAIPGLREASAQSTRTIKIVVGAAPGGSTDMTARLMADVIGRRPGLTMVVENRPGAGGIIATESVARAAPDGNTLLLTSNAFLVDAQLRKVSFHPVTRFEPVSLLVESPAVLVVNAASPYQTLGDLVNAARAKPGALSMASIGPWWLGMRREHRLSCSDN